jgi:hypothetical protein
MRLGATEPRVNWFLESSRLAAVEGRRVVNAMYARFPDRDGAMRRALRGKDDTRLLTALDELLVHELLSRRYLVIYEEGDRARPDFRLYDGRGYVGAVEVVSLFMRQDWAA